MKRILFLTTVPPDVIEECRPDWSNDMLPEQCEKRGALVTIKRWTDKDIILTIQDSDLVTFLWCEDYIQNPDTFRQFLAEVETSIKTRRHGQSSCMMNHIDLVRWNMDKRYLLDMQKAGFDIPKTEIVDAEKFDVAGLQQILQEFQASGPVVLKPSVSASSNKTRRVADTAALSLADLEYLEACTTGWLQSSLIIQQFEPSITSGEYSFVFIGDQLTHAVLKQPKSGEFRCQPQYGGKDTLRDINEVGEQTVSVVKSVFEILQGWFGTGPTGEMGYVRIDGLVTHELPFILMEIEAIEPHLYLEMEGLDEMVLRMMR